MRRSIRIVVPRLFFSTGPLKRAAPTVVVSLSEPEGRASQPDPEVRSEAGGPGLFLSLRRCGVFSDPGGGTSRNPKVRPMHSTPQRKTRHVNSAVPLAVSRPVFGTPESPEFWADKPFTRGVHSRRSGQFGTLLGATGGDSKHTRAEQVKARTTPLRTSSSSTSS